MGRVENTSSERSDYFIELAIVRGDGTQIGTADAFIENVEPGQVAEWDTGTFTDYGNWSNVQGG